MNDTKYTDFEKDFLLSLREEIRDKHKLCKGTGFLEETGEDCECLQIFRWLKLLLYSNIPKEYWNYGIPKEFKMTFKNYFDNLNKVTTLNLGMFLYGGMRVGKTTILCNAGMKFLSMGHKVFYFLLDQFVDNIFNSSEKFNKKFEECNVLLIDEIDKTYHKEDNMFIRRKVETLIRHKTSQGCIVFVASNTIFDNIAKIFSDSLYKLMRDYLKPVPVSANESLSKKTNSTFAELINSDLLLENKNNMKNYSKLYHKTYKETL